MIFLGLLWFLLGPSPFCFHLSASKEIKSACHKILKLVKILQNPSPGHRGFISVCSCLHILPLLTPFSTAHCHSHLNNHFKVLKLFLLVATRQISTFLKIFLLGFECHPFPNDFLVLPPDTCFHCSVITHTQSRQVTLWLQGQGLLLTHHCLPHAQSLGSNY